MPITPQHLGSLLAVGLVSIGLSAQEPRTFLEPEAVAAESYRLVERGEQVVAVELSRRLPGVPAGGTKFRFPFAEAVRRVEVLQLPRICTVIVAGGVHASLSLHVLRRDGGPTSVTLPRGRLLHGYFRPRVDSQASVLGCVYADAAGVQLRVFSTVDERAALLFARSLEERPAKFSLRSTAGDPRVQVIVGGVRLRAPGEPDYEKPVRPPTFVHPRARLPKLSVVRVHFQNVETGIAKKQSFQVANPNGFPMRLEFEPGQVAGWKIVAEPAGVTLAPGATEKVDLLASYDADFAKASPKLVTMLEVKGIGGSGEALAQLALFGVGVPKQDKSPPSLDRRRVTAQLLPRRRARLIGKAGAVRDPSRPCSVGAATGERVRVAEDGSFELAVALPMDGRLLLWREDARGNRSKLEWVLTIRDETRPAWERDRIELGLPVAGRTQIRASKGAVHDETPPVWVEISIDGKLHGSKVKAAADGSFSVRVPAGPGQRVQLVAVDGAAPLNRSRPLDLGRVFPYIASIDGKLTLRGPAGAGFRVVPTIATGEGVPETQLTAWRGVLDQNGQAVIDRSKLESATHLRFTVDVPASRRELVGSYTLGSK